MSEKQLKLNIIKLYVIRGIKSFMLAIPVIVLFFQENGLSMKQVFILQSLFALSVIVLEVPTGYFSDSFGRKLSLIIGGLLSVAGYAVYSVSYGFYGFLLAEIILGLGASFTSGADTAMLYDTLLELDQASEYKRQEGRISGIGLASESSSSIIGGLLALVSLRFPLYWDAATALLIVPVALTLVEPKRHLAAVKSAALLNMVRLVRFSLHDQKQVKWLIIYSSSVGASTLTMFWLTQPYLLANHIPLELFGAVLATFFLVAAGFSWQAHRVERILGRRRSLILLIALPALGYALVSSLWYAWSLVFIALFYVVRGINNPVTLDYINGLVPSDIRATVLSVKNLVSRLEFALIGPAIGWVSDAYSLQVALLSAGAVFLAFGLISLAFLRKHEAL